MCNPSCFRATSTQSAVALASQGSLSETRGDRPGKEKGVDGLKIRLPANRRDAHVLPVSANSGFRDAAANASRKHPERVVRFYAPLLPPESPDKP